MIIFTAEIAMILIEKGFKLLDKTENYWEFEDSEELEKILEKELKKIADLRTHLGESSK